MSLTESSLSLFFSPAAGFLPFFLACAARNSWICSTEHLEVPLIYMKIDGICTRMLTNADIYSSLATSWACSPTALQKFNVLCLGCRFAFRFGLAFLCCLLAKLSTARNSCKRELSESNASEFLSLGPFLLDLHVSSYHQMASNMLASCSLGISGLKFGS